MVAYNSCWSSRDRLRGSQWADGKLSVSLHGLVRLYLVCGCLVGGGKKRIFECLTTVDIGIVSIHWSSGCWITLPTLSLDTRARIFPCVSMEVHFVQMFQSNWDAVRGWRRGLVMIKRWRKIDVNAGKNGRNWVAEMRNGKRGRGEVYRCNGCRSVRMECTPVCGEGKFKLHGMRYDFRRNRFAASEHDSE